MARRTSGAIEVTEVLMHWHAGRSLLSMSESLEVDRKTIRRYIAPAIEAGITPGGPAKSEAEWQELVRGWFPELSDTRLRQVTWPATSVHHDHIAGQLKAGVRMSTGCCTFLLHYDGLELDTSTVWISVDVSPRA